MGCAFETNLTIFMTVTAVLLIVVTVFLVKLMLELSKLANNMNDITAVIKSDLEPTIKELQVTLKSINSIVQEADRKVSAFKGLTSKVLGVGSLALSNIKGFTGSFWKGLSAGMNIFKKR